MVVHWLQTWFGPVQIRVYRLREGWWPVPLGGPPLPGRPVVDDPLPRAEQEAVERMAEAIDRMAGHARAVLVAPALAGAGRERATVGRWTDAG